jgi:hypothetical protein
MEVVMGKMRGIKRRPFRRDGGDAFLPDPGGGVLIGAIGADAESAAEEFIAAVTSADYVLEDARNELSMDEIGGPFVEDDGELGLLD